MRKTARWTTALAAAGIVFAMPLAGAAQVRGGPPGGPPDDARREELQRRLQARFGQIVAQQLGLDQEEQRALGDRLRAAEEARRELRRRQHELRARFGQGVTLVPEGGPVPLISDEEAEALLGEMMALRRAETELMEEEEANLLEVLTPAELVRFYALRELLAQRVRRVQQGPRGRGGPGGGMLPESPFRLPLRR